MWKEMVFEPEVEDYKVFKHYGAYNGEVTKPAKDLMLEFLHEKWIKTFRIGRVYEFTGGTYEGDANCYQIFYYDSSVYRPKREI